MLKSGDLQKSVIWNFLRESILFGEKNYKVEELDEYYRGLGVSLGILIDEQHKAESGLEGSLQSKDFFAVIKDLFEDLGDKIQIDTKDDKQAQLISQFSSSASLFSKEHPHRMFVAGIIGGIGSKNFGYCSVFISPQKQDGNHILTVNLEETKAPKDDLVCVFQSGDILGKDLHFYELIDEKFKHLAEKNRSLEAQSRELDEKLNTTTGKGVELKIFKRNQDLEKGNLELKSQNAELGKKNVEFAFQVMELEEELAQRKSTIQEHEKSLQHKDEVISQREETISKRDHELQDLKDRSAKKEQELTEELQSTTDNLRKTEAELKETTDTLNNTRYELKETTDTLNKTRGELNETSEHLNKTRDELKDTTETLNQIRSELKEARETLEKTHEELTGTTEILNQTQDELNTTAENLDKTKTELKDTTENLHKTESELKEKTGTLHKAQDELKEIMDLHQSTQDELNETKDILRNTKSELDETQETLQKTKTEFNETMTEKENGAKLIAEQKNEISELRRLVRDQEESITLKDEQILKHTHRIEELESINEQLKDEYISKIEELAKIDFSLEQPQVVKAKETINTFDRLGSIFTPHIGPSGNVLIRGVFDRCSVSTDSADKDELAHVFTSLEQASKKIVGSHPQYAEIMAQFSVLRDEVIGGIQPEKKTVEEIPAESTQKEAVEPEEAAVKPDLVEEQKPEIEEKDEQEEKPVEAAEVAVKKPESILDEEEEEADEEKEAEAMEEVKEEIREEIKEEIREEIKEEIREEIEEEVREEIEEEIREEIKEEIREEIEEEVREEIKEEIKEEEEPGEEKREVVEEVKEEAKEEAEEEEKKEEPGEVLKEAAEEEEEVEEIDENWLVEQLEIGTAHLEKKEYEKSMELFFTLYGKAPKNQDVLKGLFYSYCGFNCWIEAYEISKKVDLNSLDADGNKTYMQSLADILDHRLKQVRNREQRKVYLLELAEIYILYQNKKQKAKEILREALKISEVTPYDEKIAYYLAQLLVEEENKSASEFLFSYTEQYGNNIEVYNLFKQHFRREASPQKMKVIDKIDAFIHLSETDLTEMYPRTEDTDIFPDIPLNMNTLKNLEDNKETWITTYFLQKVFPTLNLDDTKVSKQVANIMKMTRKGPAHKGDDEGADSILAVEKEINDFNSSIFQIKNIDILRFSGHQPFFILFNPSDKIYVVLNETNLAKLTPLERKFIVLHELVHYSRNHYKMWTMAENLTLEDKIKFIPVIKELFAMTHTALPSAVEKKLDRLGDESEDSMMEFDMILREISEGVESIQLLSVIEFLRDTKPFRNVFNNIADKFALLGVMSLKEATYAILKEEIHEDWVFEEIRNQGLQKLFTDGDTFRQIKRRVQDIWMFTLRNYPTKV